MQVEKLDFKEFSAESVVVIAKPAKPFLPGGRFKGEVPPPPPPLSFTEEQLKAAERDAYKKGFLEGTEEGKNQQKREQDDVEQKLSECVNGFAKTITPIFADYRQMALQLKQDLPKVALAIAKKVAGDALDANAQATVEATALRCAEAMIGEPKLTVTVHTSIAKALEERLKALAAQQQSAADINVIGDDSMACPDCRIEWKHGAFERHTGQLWQEVERALGNMTASIEYETKTQLDNVQSQIDETKDQPKE